MIVKVDFRAKKLGRFWPAVEYPRVMCNGSEYSEDAALGMLDDATAGKRVCVVIHGYNSPDSAVDPAYAALVEQMTREGLYAPFVESIPYETLLLVKWPGGWKGGYFAAEWRAYGKWGMPGAGDRLHDVLVKLRPAAMDIQAHSLGNGVMLDANRKGDLPIRHMICAAAAVENDWFCLPKGRMCKAVSSIAGRALVFHSKRDVALKVFDRIPFRDKALGYTGPIPEFPPCVTAVDANEWSDGHSAFRSKPLFYAAWRKLVKGEACSN